MMQLGDLRLFFYTLPQKKIISKKLINDISHKVILGISNTDLNWASPCITPWAMLYPDPVGYREGNPIFLDQLGVRLLSNHADQIQNAVSKVLDISFLRQTHDVRLILNFDGLRFYHEDYDHTPQLSDKDQKFFLVKDTTVIDWEMAKGTFSSTIVQVRESEDRFIIPYFFDEVRSVLFVEPANLPTAQVNREENTKTSSLKCELPPIDWFSTLSPGSAKGKRITFNLNGLVDSDEITSLESNSYALKVSLGQKQGDSICYPNSIEIRDLCEPVHINRKNIIVLPEYEGMEIFETPPEDNTKVIASLKELFSLNCPLNKVVVKHLVKKNAGFTKLDYQQLGIEKKSKIVIFNHSEIPEGHCYYNLAQDFTHEGLLWIQLYHLPPSKVLFIDAEQINLLALTPSEEIFYRDAKVDVLQKPLDIFKKKISSKLDLIIFPVED